MVVFLKEDTCFDNAAFAIGPLDPAVAAGLRRARALEPADGAQLEQTWANLQWAPGDGAVSHNLYFGATLDGVSDGNEGTFVGNLVTAQQVVGLPGFPAPEGLQLGTTYYWRIDEVNGTNAGSPWIGNVWSFTTGDFLVVDDFESYDDIDPLPGEPGLKRIFDKWIDGFGVPTNGATTSEELPPYAEQTIVRTGTQSMKYLYDTNMMISESTLTLVYPKDWTEEGGTKLSLWFRGSSGNAAERMFVAVDGAAVVYHDNPAASQMAGWNEWVIDLSATGGFADQGVDLTNVNTITIGFGTKNVPAAGGAGTVYFDDIRLYR